MTFTFSQPVAGFVLSDVSVVNGTLSGFIATPNPLVYTASFAPTLGVGGVNGGVSVAAGSYTNLASEPGTAAASPLIAIDTLDQTSPTLAISSSLSELIAGEVATITFTFSEPPVGFGPSDVSVAGGTISAPQATVNPLVYTATFTPTDGVANGSATISVAGSYTDAAGNAGTSAAIPSLILRTVLEPTIVVADPVLGIAESSLVTFSFGQAVSGFTNDDVTVENGTLSTLVDQGGGSVWTATFTPTSNLADASNKITLNLGGLTGLPVRTIESNSYAVDTVRPTATIAVANAQLQAGQTSQVTVTFSEAVSGFDLSDLSVANGALSNLSSSDGGVTWTATLTPSVGVVDPTNLIVLDTSLVADTAGNAGAGIAISINYQVG
ncbi:MAG: Ig-like domain-containing protein, partial [Phenylobacterium sp.]